MKKIYLIGFTFIGVIAGIYFLTRPPKSPLIKVTHQFQVDVAELTWQVLQLQHFIKAGKPADLLQKQFKKSRAAYKKTEWLAEYYYSYTAKHINGPAIKEVEADAREVIIYPEGFQVLEEYLFPAYDTTNQKELLAQVEILQSNIKRLSLHAASLETTDAHVFDALRLQVFRIISLGISGFDSPLAKNSISEAASSLDGLKQNFLFYQHLLGKHNKEMKEKILKVFMDAGNYLDGKEDFNAFDRATFISVYANPISRSLYEAQQKLFIPFFKEPRPFSAAAPDLFATEIFNPDFYTAGVEAATNSSKVILGRKLFNDVILSGNGKISCANCHQPGRAFTDGLVTSIAVDGKTKLKRNTPTLINAALQSSLFYDSRVAYLEDQVNEVVISKDEMHGSFEKAIVQIKMDKAYREDFYRVFVNETISTKQVKNAIAAYLRSLIALNSKFDLFMRGDSKAMNKEEVKGFNLFMGKAKCGSCHFLPLFNGTIPPAFISNEAEVIGVPATSDTINAIQDKDIGKFALYSIPLHKNAFRTPGLRNVELTAPYMHNGVFETLEEVVEFYNRGGGGGLSLKMDNLTLSKDKLHMSIDEKKQLIAFLKALTDTCTIIK